MWIGDRFDRGSDRQSTEGLNSPTPKSAGLSHPITEVELSEYKTRHTQYPPLHPTPPPHSFVHTQNMNTDTALLQRQAHPSAQSGRGGSIWAPQPQPTGITWPSTGDSLSRGIDGTQQATAPREPVITREDVFGPVQVNRTSPGSLPTKEVGAIGDGRKKSALSYETTVSSAYVCAYIR
jgi:hypothetical protein